MSERTGATTRIVSKVNQTAVLDALRTSGPMTLRQLRSATGLSPATVNRIVDRLRADRLIVDGGAARSSGGRPPRLLEYNSRRHTVAAVDIGARTINAAVFDLQGQPVRQRNATHHIQHPDGPEWATSVFEQVVDLIAELMAQAQQSGYPTQAVGVSVPGTVRADTGMVQFAPSLRWWDLPLAGLLHERLKVPVVVENDVNLTAVAEHRLGVARGHQDVVAFAIGTGVGAGIIIDDRLYRGAQGGAGEVGYMLMDSAALDHPWPGFGDLESRVSGRRLVERLREALGVGADELAAPQDVVTLIRAGNQAAIAALWELVDYVALALSNICAVLNPEMIVLAGGAGRELAELAIPRLTERMCGRIPLVPPIVPGEVEHVELVGAAQLAIEQTRDSRYVTGPTGHRFPA